ncbi:MAG: hypothetical protein GY791_00970, partial [Alphaproteobacteria bacterium]|nr:hypothetical protein [Alphaproteobacteria bacterium]
SNVETETDPERTEARRAFLKKAALSSAAVPAVTLMLSAGAKAGAPKPVSPI